MTLCCEEIRKECGDARVILDDEDPAPACGRLGVHGAGLYA
jgi:hypothetical protein